MRPKFTVKINPDEFTKAASRAFDYEFTGTSTFEGWEKPVVPENFGIGLIVGPSGSGKSLLLQQFGKEESLVWDESKAIVSHFSTPDEALDKLMAVGLNSIPSWCRPYHVLSNGEKFRAELARKLKTGAVIDEFTSVVDRNVAKSASVALHRFVEKNGLKNIVLASCHYDILEWLQPDWYFDTTDGVLHSGRFLRRPKITLQIYPAKRSAWSLFANHHYLSSKLNPTARTFLATAKFGDSDEEIIVGFASSITLPSGTLKNAYREHRTVVLPDFQGLGIGPKLSDAVAQFHINEGKRYFSRTAHPRFGAYRDRSPVWKKTSKYKKLRKSSESKVYQGWTIDSDRTTFSHEYIGKPSADWIDTLGE